MHIAALFEVVFFVALGCVRAQLSGHLSEVELIPPLPLDTGINYEYHGSTVLGRHGVRLTGDHRDERGWIVSKQEIEFPPVFELELEFQIQGEAKNLYGDGMALWFVSEPVKEGAMFGLDEYYKGVSIAIDTYRNGRKGKLFPRLVLMDNDGTHPYDKDNDGVANEIGGCGLRGLHNNKRQEASFLRVRYNDATRIMTVEVNYRNKWEACVSSSVRYMDSARFLALSAATGELSDSHTIRRIEMLTGTGSQAASAEASDKSTRVENNSLKKKGTGSSRGFLSFIRRLFVFVFKLILLVAVAAAAYAGWKAYKKHLRNKDDALYKLS